jgi:DNA-binding GntR family transcriptional regulator
MTEPGGKGHDDRAAPKLRQRAYDAFTQRLLAREIMPGQFVSQRELAELTGLPLGAIREVVPRLEAEGLIATVPQRGMQVAQIDLNLIKNAFQLRLFLEREAVALFATNASDAEITRLDAAHKDIVRRAEAGMSPELVEEAQAVDRDLHHTIIDYLDNEIISDAFRIIWIKVRMISQAGTRLYDRLVVPVMQDHLKITAALVARDPVRAAAAMTEHIERARKRAMGLE